MPYTEKSYHEYRIKMMSMMDGTNTVDEICVAFMKPFDAIKQIVLNFGDANKIIYISK